MKKMMILSLALLLSTSLFAASSGSMNLTQPVQLNGIDGRKNVGSDLAGGDRFERASEEIAQQHQPASQEADAFGEEKSGVSDLSSGVGNRFYQLPIDIADGEQRQSANNKSEDGSERAAARKQIVHDDQPRGADHYTEPQGEVIDQMKLAREGRHFRQGKEDRSSSNLRLGD